MISDRKGALLAEIVFVALILFVGILAVWTVFRQGNIEIHKTENNIKAYNLAVEGVEWLSSMAFDELIRLENGSTVNGMRVAIGENPDESWKILDKYQYLDAFGNPKGDFIYPSDFGGEGSSGIGTWHDFGRWAEIKPRDTSNLGTCSILMITVFVEWVEQGNQHSDDEDVVERYTRTESLSALVSRVNRL